ncbi:MAG: ATP-dependent helicase/nuclease subunit [Clostridiales bacterium]|nr:ATP-dependent helicase/nuclease subunit [Clostridiales bacterium]
MSLRFIYGRAGSGKSYFCLNDIKSRLTDQGNHQYENAPFILLVPEQFTLQAEKNLIKMIGSIDKNYSQNIMRAEVLSFRRIAYRVFNEVGGVTRQHINAAGKCMVICRIMNEIKDNLKVFSKAVKQQGFVNTLLNTISELKRYNITPDLLESISHQLQEDELLKNKLTDISVIFNKFENVLHQKYIDSDDDLSMLVEKLDLSHQFVGAELWIDEFSGFTPQEYKVIEKLLSKVKRINISLCTDCLVDDSGVDSTEVFSPTKSAVKKLLHIAKENNITVEAPVVLQEEPFYRFKNSPEMMHLERYFFSSPYRKYTQKTQDIRIFSAVNIYSEVENTARDIISLCRDRGMRYRDIAVVTRNLAGYEKLIQVIFDQYGIPCFIDRKRDINNHPLVLLVISAMDIFIKHWSYESVFSYLKTGLTDIEKEDIDVIENYVLATGIRGNMWTKYGNWDFRLNAGLEQGEMSEYEQYILAKVNEIRVKITTPLMNFRAKTKGSKKIKEICTALYEFLCEIRVPERIESRMEEFKNAGAMDLANEYGQIWNILMDVLDQVVEVMGDEKVTIERFRELLAIGFGEYKIGLIPPALDQVLVGSVERSRSHEISALYILGVNDGVFPAAIVEEGVLSDKDRETLRLQGIELAQDTRTQAFEEQYLIYTTLTTASSYLRLSYPIADSEGRTMRPSTIISRLRKLFPNIYEESNIISEDTEQENLALVAAPDPTFIQLVSAIRKQAEGFKINPLWLEVYRWYMQNEQWREKCKTALAGLFYSNLVNYIPTEKVKKLYGSPVYSSVSRLEKFASCPFAYYLQYGLKAKERKIFKLGAPDLGTFMHEVLNQFSKKVDENNRCWRDLERTWCAQTISDLVDQFIQNNSNAILNSSQRYRYLTDRLKRVLTRAVWLIVEHMKRSSFEPLGYEMAFEDKGDFPPITITLPNGETIKLIGRIDRVDTMQSEEGTYLRIIDYKSGTKAFKLSDVYYGLQIQLITYLDAIWESGNRKISQPILPGGILYFRIDDPIVQGESGMAEEEIEKAIMKQLKMKGLLLADVKLIKEMDRQMEGDSLIIPARINKGDVLGKSSSAATIEQFEVLRKHVKKLLVQLGEEMLKGDVSINPYKKKKFTSCTYCNYASVCQFDPSMKDNKFRIMDDMKDEEVWKLIGNEK